MRDFWRGEPGDARRVRLPADRLLRPLRALRPHARSRRINFVTAHDGFTLRDLVSYNEKHNEANGEDNRDGESHNRSWNCGVEGPTDDPEIHALRARQQRNFLATLLLSQGVPMLAARRRDRPHPAAATTTSTARTTSSSWVDWDLDDDQTRPARRSPHGWSQLRSEHPVFRRRRFFDGDADHGGESELGDIAWFTPDGDADGRRGLGRRLRQAADGVPQRRRASPSRTRAASRSSTTRFLLLFNAHSEPVDFTLPPEEYGEEWAVRVDTTLPTLPDDAPTWEPGSVHPIAGRSVVVLSTPPVSTRG